MYDTQIRIICNPIFGASKVHFLEKQVLPLKKYKNNIICLRVAGAQS